MSLERIFFSKSKKKKIKNVSRNPRNVKTFSYCVVSVCSALAFVLVLGFVSLSMTILDSVICCSKLGNARQGLAGDFLKKNRRLRHGKSGIDWT